MNIKIVITLVILNIHVTKQSKNLDTTQRSQNKLFKSNSYENILFDEHSLGPNHTESSLLRNTHTPWNKSVFWNNQNNTKLFNESCLQINYERLSKIIILIIYIIIWIICVFGNILVIISVFTYKPLQSTPNAFIVSLAIADTFVALFVMPFHIMYHITDGVWLLDSYTCHFFLTLDILLCTSSILHLCCIALDRYWSIKNSIKYTQKRTMKTVLTMISIAWVASLVISFPVIIWNTKTVGNRPINHTHSSDMKKVPATTQDYSKHGHHDVSLILVCDIPNDKLYRIYSSMGTFYLPLLIMTFVYIQIYLETRKRLKERAKQVKRLAQSMHKSTQCNRAITSASKKQVSSQKCKSFLCCFVTSVKNGSSDKVVYEKSLNNNDNKTDSIVLIKDQQELNGGNGTLVHFADNVKEHTFNEIETKEILNGDASLNKWQRRTVGDSGKMLRDRQKSSQNRERRTARTLGFIMGSFIFCWLPFFIVYLLQSFDYFIDSESLFTFLTCLGYVNSALNPIIYTVFNIDFRKSFKRIIFQCVLFKSRY